MIRIHGCEHALTLLSGERPCVRGCCKIKNFPAVYVVFGYRRACCFGQGKQSICLCSTYCTIAHFQYARIHRCQFLTFFDGTPLRVRGMPVNESILPAYF